MTAVLSKMPFCTDFVYLNKRLIDFSGRPYLRAIYEVSDRNLVLRCSRQVEKSTFLGNSIVHAACTRPGVQLLYVCPREEQARRFSRDRLLPVIEQSPLIRRLLLGRNRRKPPVMNLEFSNGSRLFLRAAYNSADACRGLSADMLFVDEFQDIAAGHLPVLQETLSHAASGISILVGTPKSVENHLEAYFSQSTAQEWQVPCQHCQQDVVLDERCLGLHAVVCPRCQNQLFPSCGRWVPRHPDARWEGFALNHLMVPWLEYDAILERQRTYDLVKFKNEVLGLSSTTGDHVVTRSELEACCSEHPMVGTPEDIPLPLQGPLVAGIDWGGGGTSRTVLVIGVMRQDFCFQILRFERFEAQDDPGYVLEQLAQRCLQFRVQWIAADGGGIGSVQNRLLVGRLGGYPSLYAIYYSLSDHSRSPMESSRSGRSIARARSACYSAASKLAPFSFRGWPIAVAFWMSSPVRWPNTTISAVR